MNSVGVAVETSGTFPGSHNVGGGGGRGVPLILRSLLVNKATERDLQKANPTIVLSPFLSTFVFLLVSVLPSFLVFLSVSVFLLSVFVFPAAGALEREREREAIHSERPQQEKY